jgi:hypothetical protein
MLEPVPDMLRGKRDRTLPVLGFAGDSVWPATSTFARYPVSREWPSAYNRVMVWASKM